LPGVPLHRAEGCPTPLRCGDFLRSLREEPGPLFSDRPYSRFFITNGRYSRVDGGVPVGVGVAGVTVAVGVPLRLLHSDPGTCAASAGGDLRVGHRDSSRGSDRQQYTSPMTKGKLCRSTFALDSRRPILL